MCAMSQLILASGSQYRLKLLKDIGIDCIGVSADIDEYAILGNDPIETATLRANAKANFVFATHSDSIVIAADQVVYLGADIMDKPKSDEEWLLRLKRMRGQMHLLSTAVCIRTPDLQMLHFVETTEVYFRSDLTDEMLQTYVKIGEARGCAGGYMMEQKGAWLIEKIVGDWQNVIGLPIFGLTKILRDLGVPMFGKLF